MTDHVSQDAIERFVEGRLRAGAAAGFERHVSACNVCADRLSGEAQLQMTLEALIPGRTPALRRTSGEDAFRQSSARAGALLALAAGVLFLIRPAATSHSHLTHGFSSSSRASEFTLAVDAGVGGATEPMVASVDGGRFGMQRGAGWLASPSN